MPKKTEITINLKELDNLKTEFSKKYITKVGILASGKAGEIHPASEGKSITYLMLGMIHEFGSFTRNIPARSFLRMPIETKKQELVKLLQSDRVKLMVQEKRIKAIYTWLGIIGEGIVQRAFASGGYGKWEPNAPATIRKKGSAAPLIETGEFRKAVGSEVVSKGRE